MDLLRTCLLLALCLSMVAHAVFSAPAFSSDPEGAQFETEYDPDMILYRDYRSADEEGGELLSRLRRQVAQMASSKIYRNEHGRRNYHSRGRLAGRRAYANRRNQGEVTRW